MLILFFPFHGNTEVLAVICFQFSHVVFLSSQTLYKQYVMKRNQRKRQREEDLKKESAEKRLKTTDEDLTGSTSGNPGKNEEITKEGGEKIITDNSVAAQEELIKEGDDKMSTDHTEVARDELIKQ